MHFERDALVMLKVLPVFKHVTDAEFECALALVSVERVEVGVLGFPHVAVFVEVLLTATVGDLVPERGVCGQPRFIPALKREAFSSYFRKKRTAGLVVWFQRDCS